MRHGLTIGAPVALLLAFSATVGPAAYAQRQRVLPQNSVLKVKLDDRLSSDTSRRGERFTATVTDQGSGYSLPDGTQVIGTVAGVQRANSKRPGSLDVDFTALRLPDGQRYQIAGSPISLDSNSVERTSDGRLVSRSNSNNKLKFLAYGAGAGFVIGSLLGSNIKGALAGAAAGYLYGMLNKNKANGHDVVLKPGTEFGVRLDQEVALGSASPYSYRQRQGYATGYGSSQRLGTGYGNNQTPARGYGYNRPSASGYGYNRPSGTGYGANSLSRRSPDRYAASQTVLPADSVLKVKLNDQLSSDTSHPGDRFTATVASDTQGYNLPAGTRVEGIVREAQPGTDNQPGTLDVDFTALRLPDGQTYQIAGAPISLDSKSVEHTSDGRLVARPGRSNDRTKFIAYGAGAGLIIGSLLGSNIKGALAGAAAGYLFGQYNKKKANGHDVVLKPGTEFGVRLDQRVALTAPRGYGYR